MAQLAIKGHPTKGKEVIEILEMLGGINKHQITAIKETYVYFVDEDGIIRLLKIQQLLPEQFIVFTLEVLLKKFPYKIGDRVIIKSNNQEAIVTEVTWEYNTIMYRLKQNDDLLCKYIAYELQPYEETMEEELMPKIDFSKYCKNKYLLDMGDYEIKVEDGKTYVVRKRTQYPKTYEECCDIMDIDVSRTIGHDDCPFYKDVTCYEHALLSSLVHLRKLLICRDAYWKIAGEEMGLDKPWEQDYDDRCFIIANNNGNIHTYEYHGSSNVILAFPTEEMRDAFYENFKDLIEQCKELL